MAMDIDSYPDAGYDQVKRPRFHFSSKKHWINDPNGLVCCDGEYRLFAGPVEEFAMKVLVDRPSVEIFGNRWRVNIAALLPTPGAAIASIQVTAEGCRAAVASMTVTGLKSGWGDR